MSEKNLKTDETECRSVRIHFVRTKGFEEAVDDLSCYVDALQLSKTKAAFLNTMISEALLQAERSGFKQGFEAGKEGVFIEFS